MDNSHNLKQSEAILTLNNLETGYRLSRGKKIVLHTNLTCSIVSGELIAMLGPNGAGKSTLLKTITGMISPLDGEVFYGGKNLNNMSSREIASNVSLVLTDRIDDRYLRAIDIVGTGRYPYGSFMGKLSDNDKEIIHNSLRLVDSKELSNRYFYSLSDGEKQKIMLARAIAQDTPLIFLDEPTAFIDSPGKVQIMNLLIKLVKEHNKSILLTTHDTELALNSASNLWLLGKDKLFIKGHPDTLVENGMINKLFDKKGVVFNKSTRRFESEV